MAYAVYVHTNKANGKRYVGITSQKRPNDRWHNGDGYKKQKRFYSAIKCYGWDGFAHDVLFTGLTKDAAEKKERELIAEYRSNNEDYGYNIENGGNVGKISEAQKQHLREINTGKHHSEATKEKMRCSHIGLSTKWLSGRKPSIETRIKMGKSRSGDRNSRARSVVMLDADDNIIATFKTMNDAAKSVGAYGSAHISDCCRGKKEMAHGYKWAYRAVV